MAFIKKIQLSPNINMPVPIGVSFISPLSIFNNGAFYVYAGINEEAVINGETSIVIPPGQQVLINFPLSTLNLISDGDVIVQITMGTEYVGSGGSSGGGGPAESVTVTNWPATQNVNLTGQSAGLATEAKQDDVISAIGSLQIEGVSMILTGEVDPNNTGDYPKLVAPNGSAIKIKADISNTSEVLVSDQQNDMFGAWPLSPGESEEFYYPQVYVFVPDGVNEAQTIHVKAITYK